MYHPYFPRKAFPTFPRGQANESFPCPRAPTDLHVRLLHRVVGEDSGRFCEAIHGLQCKIILLTNWPENGASPCTTSPSLHRRMRDLASAPSHRSLCKFMAERSGFRIHALTNNPECVQPRSRFVNRPNHYTPFSAIEIISFMPSTAAKTGSFEFASGG